MGAKECLLHTPLEVGRQDDTQPILLLSVQGTHLPYKGLCTIERTERPLTL